MNLTRRQFLQRSTLALASAGLGCKTVSPPPDNVIIDTHLHLWNLEQQSLPWLRDAPAILKKTYRLQDWHLATVGLPIRAVYMEVDVDEATLADEASRVLDLASRDGSPVLGAVIGGRPASPEFGAYVKRYRGNPRFKGVRQVLHSKATPAGFCLQPDFARGVQMLGDAGKSFDLCMRAPELLDGAKLAAECPGTRFVLDHCGNPDLKCFRSRRDGEPLPAHTAEEWKRSIDALAARPNVICKISGIAASLPANGETADLAPAVNHCLDAFGPERVVFGGDWPVVLLGASYLRWVRMLREIVASRPAAQQQQLWAGNARRFYGLG